jgi:hypothetical protein
MQPAKNSTLVLQGMGRNAQETLYFTNDTLHMMGCRFVKSSELPELRGLAPLAKIKVKAPTLKSPRDVLDDLKKRIREERRL